MVNHSVLYSSHRNVPNYGKHVQAGPLLHPGRLGRQRMPIYGCGKFPIFVFTSVPKLICYLLPGSQPGTTVTTKTTTTTTTSVSGGSDLSASSIGLSGSDRALIRSSWEKARKDGDVSPKILLK